MTSESHTIKAFKVTQPIGDFYVSKIPFDVITKCAKANIREIVDNLETMTGIQRLLADSRVKEIREFVKSVDASFPNSVILNLNPNNLIKTNLTEDVNEEELEFYEFTIKVESDTFEIIDGQHRLAGLKEVENNGFEGKFDVIVSFYIDLPLPDQAYLFSTINSKQSNVNKSLVMDLFSLSEYEVPEKCAHLITKQLNSDRESPLYQRIKLLGRIPKFSNENLYQPVLSQANVAGKIRNLISRPQSLVSDRNIITKGRKLELSDDNIKKGLIFRNYFVSGESDIILKILLNFFNSVKSEFPKEWDDEENPLYRTIGFNALMKFMVDLVKEGENEKDYSESYFKSKFRVVRENYIKDSENFLTKENYNASTSGESKLYRNLKKWMGWETKDNETE